MLARTIRILPLAHQSLWSGILFLNLSPWVTNWVNPMYLACHPNTALFCSVTSCMFYEFFEESKHALFNVVSKDHTAIHLRNTTLIEKYNYSKSQLESLPLDCTPFNGGQCSIDSKFTYLFFVICLPTKHLRVLRNSLKHICAFEIELDFESFGF